jgi:hypothetical protein
LRIFEVLAVVGLVSFQEDGLRQDAVALLTAQNAACAVGGAALAAGAYSGRDDLHNDLRGAWYIKHPSDFTDVYGSASFNLPLSVSLSVIGHLMERPELYRLGTGLTRTLTLTHLIIGPIKLAAHRRRPDGSDSFSFPSGHAANTFAVARYLHREYGTRAALLPYAMAITTAAGRMEGNRHYLSDVVMGATIGMLVGNTVGRDRDSRLGVAAMRGGTGVLAVISLE